MDEPIYKLFQYIKNDKHLQKVENERFYKMIRKNISIKGSKFSGRKPIRNIYENFEEFKETLKFPEFNKYDLEHIRMKLYYIRTYQLEPKDIETTYLIDEYFMDEEEYEEIQSINKLNYIFIFGYMTFGYILGFYQNDISKIIIDNIVPNVRNYVSKTSEYYTKSYEL
jgi:hypothetical protein